MAKLNDKEYIEGANLMIEGLIDRLSISNTELKVALSTKAIIDAENFLKEYSNLITIMIAVLENLHANNNLLLKLSNKE